MPATAMEISSNTNDCANEMMLLERVFLRLGSADTDEQLEACLNKFLAPVILKLSSPHEPVRTKVMELLVHVNKRVKCRSEVQLPVTALLQQYRDPAATNFVINFSIIYLSMGFPRLAKEEQLQLAPSLLDAIENRPQSHQDSILVLVMPLLGEIKPEKFNLKEKPKLAKLILNFATDVLLLPYRALPSNKEEGSEFQVPPGMSLKTYKRITSKNVLNANQLEQMKLSIVNFLSNDFLPDSDILLPLIVAAADSRFSIANQANSPLARVSSSVDWSTVTVCAPMYSLYLGTWGGMRVSADDRKVAACTRLRLKLLHYLNKAMGAGIMFPHCVQALDPCCRVLGESEKDLRGVCPSVDVKTLLIMMNYDNASCFLSSLVSGHIQGKYVNGSVPPNNDRIGKNLDAYVQQCTETLNSQSLSKIFWLLPPLHYLPLRTVIFSSLFDENSNSRLRNLAISFLLVVVNNGEEKQLQKVSSVLLEGLLKLVRGEEYAEHHSRAYTCIGRLAIRMPSCVNSQFAMLEEFVKKVPEATPELKTALRDALLDMAHAFRISCNEKKVEAMETSESQAGGSSQKEPEKMEVDDISSTKSSPNIDANEPQALALFALLDHYMHNDESMIRYIAMRYASVVFPHNYIPAKYLLLLASGDSQDDVSTEALKCLYGTSRKTEIDDIVNNVSKKQSDSVDGDSGGRTDGRKTEAKAPGFQSTVNYIWDQLQKRKTGSNAKHRFVYNNQVLPFHPLTYQEILRYLRMCLNHEANLKDCSTHPNANSPLLAKYINETLVDTEVLDRYLTMITSLLIASPELMPLTCLLDIIGCAPSKLATKYTNLLPFLKNLFITSLKEEIREMASIIYAIITTHTSDKAAIDREILEFVSQASGNKSLESQCGYISAFSNLCERCIGLSKREPRKFGGKGFTAVDWEPYKESALCLANFLSSPQNLLVSTSCTNIALLSRTSALPYPDSSPEQESTINSDKPLNFGKVTSDKDEDSSGPVTKFSIVERLFKIINNAKFTSKIKEKSLYALGVMCCGERFPFAKQIVKGFLEMAKDSKEFEIHLEVGESLVLCVEGVNSNESRDLWTEPPLQGEAKIRDCAALEENDVLLTWLLNELITLSKTPHPHSRQATSIWLLALLKNCSEREPIRSQLPLLQEAFMDFLSENSEIVQDVASKGLSLVYQSSDPEQQKALVSQIIEQLTSGKRKVAQVTEDTKIFEEGQLGKSPTGGNLSTYKELCSLASDLNQPDLLYKFMHLAHHNAVWNSKKGAAFGFHSIATQAGAQLSEHLPRIVPRLYRYRFDPTPKIQNSMCSIWQALVPETQKTVHKYHKEILDDLVTNLTSPQWRVRMSCCNALADLLRGATSLHESLERLPELWTQLFRVMDDVHEGTRTAATSTAAILSKLCIRASDVNQGKDGKEIVSAILPVLLEKGITDLVREVRNISLQTVSKLVTAAGESLRQFLPQLIPALVTAAGELESVKLSYLSTALGSDSGTQEAVDDVRAAAARHHYTTETVVKCVPYLDMDALNEMLPKMLELTKSPQLGTKVACCHFFTLLTHHLRGELEPVAGKIMLALLNGTLDRNATVRKNCGDALGQVAACAKASSGEKLMKKLVLWYETRDDDISRSAVAYTLKSVARTKPEILKDNAEIIAPMVFFATHGSKTEENNTVEMFEDIWTELSPGRETGMRQYLVAISAHLQQALDSRSWTHKAQAANAVSALASLTGGLGTEREPLLRSLLAAAHGKTFEGKQHILNAMAKLCTAKEGEAKVSPALADECIESLLTESRKSEPVYKRHALCALGDTLAARDVNRFHSIYDIVKSVLVKDESLIGKDSDDEDNEGARQRREQLTALKEAAYEILGKAWPKDLDTQKKYQEIVFSHCAKSYPLSTRPTQLVILAALGRVLERLVVLNEEPMDVDNALKTDAAEMVESVVGHVATVIEYTLKSSNQTRHRREALGLMNKLARKLKDLGYTKEFNKLKAIYQTYAPDLSKDPSHEIRAKLDEGKLIYT